MHELRKDYLLDEWVIIATGRFKRPKDIPRVKKKESLTKCPFCPGNEHLTPPEILRVPQEKKWRIRVFPNKFRAVSCNGKISRKSGPFFNSKTAYGRHEIIVETPEHGVQLCDLSTERIAELFSVYVQRLEALKKVPSVEEVSLFKNWGKKSGASLEHSHTQILALNKLSEKKKKELRAFSALKKKDKKCPYCSVLSSERKSKRFIFENSSAAAIAPFASKEPFEVLILPKRHVKKLSELSEQESYDMAFVLKRCLLLLKKKNASYNFFLQESCCGKDFHFYFRILPRITTRGGFEEQTECIINPVLPAEAAREYRAEFKGRVA